jgi:putative two-component system response regulator
MNKRLLFVDDERRVLEALRRMLRPQRREWDIICADGPRAAWTELQHGRVDVVVSDVSMPEMSGLELLKRIKRSDRLQEIPVLMLTGLESREVKRQALDLGAADLLNKPVDPEDLVARLRSMLRLKAYQDELKTQNAVLEDKVQQRTAELQHLRMDVIWRLGKAAEHRDNETRNHVIRVGCASRIIAERMGTDRDFVDTLFVAAPLHDIGKIGIPDSILTKAGPLNDREWKIMKQHCQLGAKILQEDARAEAAFFQWLGHAPELGGNAAGNPVLRVAATVALSHHEKWDGTGYPQGLAGEAVPVEARIVAIADVFDALTSRRSYKAPYPEDEALEILEDTAAGHFDPAVYAAFLESLPAIRSVQGQFSDQACVWPALEEARREADLVCG